MEKFKSLISLAMITSMIVLTGCWQSNGTQERPLEGAVLGAAVGAGVGPAVGSKVGTGIAIGAGAGAVAGTMPSDDKK